VYYNLAIVILCGILYWLSDHFISNFVDFSKKYNLGKVDKPYNVYEYFYFALVTQTSVGYGGLGQDIVQDTANKKRVNNIYEFLNTFQLISIIYIYGLAFQN